MGIDQGRQSRRRPEKAAVLAILLLVTGGVSAESTCYGNTGEGRLEGAVRLPMSGENFESYGLIPWLAGRTWVHGKVHDIVIDAYDRLEAEHPDRVFQYAETGFKEGGPFDPHKTHQNGLSVDFIVPVTNAEGDSVHLPANPFNRYGYDIQFDAEGRFEEFRIDFEALGAHIVALHKAARARDAGIWRVLLDPRLQPALYETRYGDYIEKNVEIPGKRSWVRHDDHYHVDFAVTCEPMNPE